MRKFTLITNDKKDPGLIMTKRIEAYLARKGAETKVAPLHTSVASSALYLYTVEKDSDCLIVLGGDGTMLQAANSAFGMDIPMIGVNMGTMGYLTEIEEDGLEKALDRLLTDDYDIQERMMLRGEFVRNSTDVEIRHALNDIVIARSSSLRVIPFNIYVNGLFLNRYEADGILLSTPTGSTGYNMSAGGPIVEPGARSILLTPICPHTMGNSSIVLSPEDKVTVELGTERDPEGLVVEATFDGMYRNRFTARDRIDITKSSHTAKIVRLNSENFLETLHRKMK